MPVTLEYRGDFDVRSLLVFFAAHEVSGLDCTEQAERRHTRVVPTDLGPRVLTVEFPSPGAVTLAVDAEGLEQRVRSWLSLDADIAAIERHLGTSPVLAPLIEKRPGLRFLGSMNPFESAVLTILGQHVSLVAARTFGARLVAAYGSPLTEEFSAFPEPAVLAAVDTESLRATVGVTTARARSIIALSQTIVDGDIELSPNADVTLTAKQLLALPGIGPWTADYLAIRVFGDQDGFLGGDLVLRKALGVKTAKEAEALAESWRPYRAYAMLHLWTETALHGE